MSRKKVSLSFIGTITFAALISPAISIPISSNSTDIKCARETILPPKFPPKDFSRKYPAIAVEELAQRGLFNLAKGAITPLSRIANIVLNLAADQQERRSVSIPPEKPKLEMISELEEHGVGGTDRLEKMSSVEVSDREKLEFKPRKFHCHPIEDIFIPAVDKMVPAYICKLESRQFILSSERFLEDYKYHLDISVDETTFHHLLIPDATTAGINSVANVIPVTLTQRRGDQFYGVKRT